MPKPIKQVHFYLSNHINSARFEAQRPCLYFEPYAIETYFSYIWEIFWSWLWSSSAMTLGGPHELTTSFCLLCLPQWFSLFLSESMHSEVGTKFSHKPFLWTKGRIFFKLYPPPLLCSLPTSPLSLFECSPFMSFTSIFILQPSSSLLSHLFRILFLITCKFPETNFYQLHFSFLPSPVPENRLF